MGLPITVTVGALATADPDGISLSQAAAGAQHLVLNGAFASFDADAIALAQAVAGAGNLTLAGATVNDGVAYLGAQRRVYITSAGDDTGITFTVTGTIFALRGSVAVVETVTGVNAGIVSTSKVFDTVTQIAASGAAAGNVSAGIHGGNAGDTVGGASVGATMDKARRVIITSSGNDLGITFTVTGTDVNGNRQSEAVTGASGAAASTVLDYKTVTSVLTSGVVAGTVTVGTNGVAASRWVRLSDWAAGEVAIQCTAEGTVDYTVQQTMEDPNRVTNNRPPNTYQWAETAITWVNHSDSDLVNATGDVQGNYAYPPVYARVLLNSGTGSVAMTLRQMG